MVITVSRPKRMQPETLARLLLILPFFLSWLPGGAGYLLDLVWLLLVVFLICFWSRLGGGRLGGLALWVLTFLGLTAAVYLVQFQSAWYYLWGFRNNFRFYAAFFSFALFLRQRDVEDIWRLFDRLFWLNFLISLIQFLIFDLRGDYLGGLFGAEQGCNGYTNIFLAVTVTKSVVFYLEGMGSSDQCLAKCAAALLLAALAELKFFFVEFAVILLLAVLFGKCSRRLFLLGIAAIAGAGACALLLYRLFPEFGGWFHPSDMLETATADAGYSSAGDLNRLTAISDISRKILRNWGQRLFGLGMGNCDYAGFDFLTSPFYRGNEGLHYTWMSHSFLFLETGYLGLVFFFGFFVLIFFAAGQWEKKYVGRQRAYCRVGRILAVLCMVIGIYNASLRSEAGFFAYFAMALPFGRREHGKDTCAKRVL